MRVNIRYIPLVIAGFISMAVAVDTNNIAAAPLK